MGIVIVVSILIGAFWAYEVMDANRRAQREAEQRAKETEEEHGR